MANIGNASVGGAVHTLPKGVSQCEGIPRKSWITKCVALKNDVGMVVGKGIHHNVSSNLIIDSENQPLGDDCVVRAQFNKRCKETIRARISRNTF